MGMGGCFEPNRKFYPKDDNVDLLGGKVNSLFKE